MKGMPIQQLTKSTKGLGLAETNASASAEALGVKVDGKSKEAKENFSTLFAQLMGNDSKKPSEVKSENGEVLGQLLESKSLEKNSQLIQEQSINSKGMVHSKALEMKNVPEILSQASIEKNANSAFLESAPSAVESKVVTTNNKLDQLLNNLKGTQETIESSEGGEIGEKTHSELDDLRQIKKNIPGKSETKIESPLDFLMNQSKDKGISEENKSDNIPKLFKDNSLPEEVVNTQNKIMSAEDFLSNKKSFEKKLPNISFVKGSNDLEIVNNPIKNSQNNVKTTDKD